MTIDDCYFLGKVTKLHGLKGEVVLWLDVDDPTDYEEMDSVFLKIKDDLVPYFIDELQIRGKKSIAKFEDIDSVEKAMTLVGLDMYLPLNVLPELEGNRFYYHEVIGYTLLDKGKAIGTLSAVYEGSGQDLMALDIDGKEVLIPIVDEIITGISHPDKAIHLDLPEGLIDIYLDA